MFSRLAPRYSWQTDTYITKHTLINIFVLCNKDNAGYDSETAGSDGNYGVWTYPPAGSSLLQAAAGSQPFPAYTSSGVGTMAYNSPATSGTKVNALDR